MRETEMIAEFPSSMRSLLKVVNAESKNTRFGWHFVVCLIAALTVFAFAWLPNKLPEMVTALVGAQSSNSTIMLGEFAVSIKTPISAGHLLGLIFGIGGLVAGDLLMIRMLQNNRITVSELEALKIVSRFVTIGLTLLWITGLGFLVYYSFFSQDTLANPKIWAKLAIIFVLSLNGLFIHQIVIPKFAENIDGKIFSDQENLVDILITPGAVSLVSWAMAFVLGATPALSFSVSGYDFMSIYVMALAIGIIIAQMIVSKIGTQARVSQTKY